jgi:von Willebrand factor type A domain
MGKNHPAFVVLVLVSSILLGGGGLGRIMAVRAQSEGQKPINLMIVLDNSCSMFPRERIPVGCTDFGSDVNFLRIRGADLFLARLGFGQANEADYRVGIVSLGDEPKLISPLVPLTDSRDYLASKIANPAPEKATELVPALKMAYQNLRNSPNLKPGSQPAVVLITDGVPYPPEGQSNADIEKLIKDNSDIPLFLMLLKGSSGALEEFDQYVKFWQDLQLRYNNVFVSLIENPNQIEDTYNTIVAMLQDTIPSKAIALAANTDLPFYISKYIDQVVITISYPSGSKKGTVRVSDPNGEEVKADEAGVFVFKGRENPVEVISIAPPRLAASLTDQNWNLRSDQATNIFIDRQGVYRVDFLVPEVSDTGVNNVYLAAESQSPRQAFPIKFRLITADGKPILEPQLIGAEVLLPDSTQAQLPLDQNIVPDKDGVYELSFDLPSIYPYVSTQFGRFMFVIHAGSADPNSEQPIPIASARLLVDVGPIPFIQLVSPAKVECRPGSSQKISVSLGDFQSVEPDSLKSTITGEGREVVLIGEGGELRGEVSQLCQVLVANLACDEQQQSEFKLNVQALLKNGQGFTPLERTLPVIASGEACTPTPGAGGQAAAQVNLVTPTAYSELPVDSDNDQLNDQIDQCPSQPGWRIFNGCPPPRWVWIVSIALLLGAAIMIASYPITWLYVHYFAKPPEGYIMVCRRNVSSPEILDIYETGLRRRTRKVKIGGDKKKSHLFIAGLRPKEFVVKEKGGKVILVDAKRGDTKATFRQLTPEVVPTSNPEVILWIAIKRNALEKVSC